MLGAVLWAAALSSSPAVPEQFLLYDVIFHEQVNKQRRALMFYLDLAMITKRTLVLPRTRLLRRVSARSFSPDAEYVPWGELYNVSALAKLHPIIELEQYLELHGPVALHVKLDHRGCPEGGEGEVAFNGLKLGASRTICTTGLQYNRARLTQGDVMGLDSIAFSDSVDQLSLEKALQLRPYVRFDEGVYSSAAAFVAEQFGGSPFLAIHWRRTDFLQARASQRGVLQSAEEVVRHARLAMQKHGLTRVYLATDCDDERELSVVRDALSPVRLTSRRGTGAQTLRERTEHANLEIVICAMAARFLGTKTSSFTLAITEERSAIFGHAPTTSGEMDILPLAENHNGGPRKDEL